MPRHALAASPSLSDPNGEWSNCNNVQLQRGAEAVCLYITGSERSDQRGQAVRVGASLVAGYGLFADQDIEKGQLIMGETFPKTVAEGRIRGGSHIGRGGEQARVSSLRRRAQSNAADGVDRLVYVSTRHFKMVLRYCRTRRAEITCSKSTWAL